MQNQIQCTNLSESPDSILSLMKLEIEFVNSLIPYFSSFSNPLESANLKKGTLFDSKYFISFVHVFLFLFLENFLCLILRMHL